MITAEEIYSQLSPSARKQLKIMHNQQLRILEFYLKLNHPDDPELAIRIHQTCEGMSNSSPNPNLGVTLLLYSNVFWK